MHAKRWVRRALENGQPSCRTLTGPGVVGEGRLLQSKGPLRALVFSPLIGVLQNQPKVGHPRRRQR